MPISESGAMTIAVSNALRGVLASAQAMSRYRNGAMPIRGRHRYIGLHSNVIAVASSAGAMHIHARKCARLSEKMITAHMAYRTIMKVRSVVAGHNHCVVVDDGQMNSINGCS